MTDPLMEQRRPRLALPYTILTGDDLVRLVAGEDFRYTLEAPGLERWLPALLARLDGAHTIADTIAAVDPAYHVAAREILARLYGERILIDGPPQVPQNFPSIPQNFEGAGVLFELLKAGQASLPAGGIRVLCQDRLDYHEALEFNARCRKERSASMWATCGPLTRAYVSPLFLPDCGPCLGCLIAHFQRLSPASEIYSHLIEHSRKNLPIEPAPFSPQGLEILKQLVLWKLSLAAQQEPPAALFRLHVLETDALEITSHRVLADPLCAVCGET